MRRLLARAAACVIVAVPILALAFDRPIPATKLGLKRAASGKETLVFGAKGDAIFPVIGSADDPATGTPGGARIELFAGGPTVAVFDVPPGAGWTVVDGPIGRYTYVNRSAPVGPSTIAKLAFKQGKYLKIKGRSVGLPLLGSQGAIAIRITTGTLRNCARFGPASIVKDVPGKYLARFSTTTGFTDCSAAALGGAICGNGVQEPDEACDGGDALACPGQCQADCTCSPRCGDDEVNQPSEQCDGTAGGSCPAAACLPSCLCPVCGDGLVDQPFEQCDGADDAACPGECQPSCVCLGICGDGIVNQPSEQCDGSTGMTSVACRPPASPGECRYCSVGGVFCGDFGCCSADEVCIPGPHSSGTCCIPPGGPCATNGDCCAGTCIGAGTCMTP